MHIQVISVGKVREKYIKLGIAEFEKRLGAYCKLTLMEVADEQAPEKLSDKELEQVKDKEGARILNHIKNGYYVIALDVQGDVMTSEKFAAKMESLGLQGKSKVVFVIGGSNGLSMNVLRRANMRLSFSNMTFPHQLMKLILLEQVYRGFRIARGEPYHK